MDSIPLVFSVCFLHSETKRRVSIIPIFISTSDPSENIPIHPFEAGQKMRSHLQ